MDTAKPVEKSLYTMVEKSIIRYNRGNYSYFAVFGETFITTAISIISIPLSLLMALIALRLSDVSLNILTLGALTVAIGRVMNLIRCSC